jgi:hypothetical protein
MALVPIPFGLLYSYGFPYTLYGNPPVVAFTILDVATEKAAYIGRCYVDGRATKTISAAGGGSISVATGSVTFANGSTSVTVGIQDVATGSGPPSQPDGVFDVQSAAQVGGSGAFVANSMNTIPMTGGSGSKTIANGDLIAVVVDMTAVAGGDAISMITNTAFGNNTGIFQQPAIRRFTGGVWSNALNAMGMPNCVITFDDGTLGIIMCGWPYASATTETFSDATNPDERGLIFQVPWDCAVDSFEARISSAGATSGFTMALYADPLGSPTVLATRSINGRHLPTTLSTLFVPFTSAVNLQHGVDYCVAVQATGAGSVTMYTANLGTTGYRVFFPGSTTLRKGTRNNATGAFTEETPAVTVPAIACRLSALPA